MLVRKTRTAFDWGFVMHVLYGFLSVQFGQEWLFTVIFLFKQALDYIAGEDAAETSGDILEYAAGMILALSLKTFMRM
jgi:hypothetical protein